MKSIVEYIWMGGKGEFRSKTMVTKNINWIDNGECKDMFPEWNYDGSSTGQASDSGNTEIV